MFEWEVTRSIFLPLKLPKALQMAFFIFFLEAKYSPTSIASPFLAALFLQMIGWSSCKLSFDWRRKSLAMLHTSKSLRDPSSSSSTFLLLNSLANSYWDIGNWSTLSMKSCKSCKPLSLWLWDEEADSEDFNLLWFSSNCDTKGWGAKGKLLDLICRELFKIESKDAILSSQ